MLLFCDFLMNLIGLWLSVHPRRDAIINATPFIIHHE